MIGIINITWSNLFYDGTWEPYELDEAIEWKARVPQRLVTVKIFGEDQKQFLPIMKNGEDVTYEFQKWLGDLVTTWKLSHYKLRQLQEILKWYTVVRNGIWDIWLKEKTEQYSYDMKSILLAKEMLDWYYNFWYYRGKNVENAQPIWQTYDIKLRSEDYKVYGAYAPALRQKMFDGTPWSMKSWKLLQDWQNMYQIIMWHVTWVLVKRSWWKTYVNAMVAIREITKHRNKGKPNSVVYISANDVKLEDVRTYIREFAGQFPGVYTFANDRLTFYTYETDENGVERQIINGYIDFQSAAAKNPAVGTHPDLYILDEAGITPYSVYKGIMDIVYDEWAKLCVISTVYEDQGYDHWFFQGWMDAYSRSIWMNIPKIIEDFYIDNYERIQKADIWVMQDISRELQDTIWIVWYLVTVDMVEIQQNAKTWQTKGKDILQELKWDEYFAQCWWVIPESSKVFDIGAVLRPLEDDKSELYVLSWDPAKEWDISAVTVIWYKDLHVTARDEYALNENNEDYPKQLQRLQEIIDFYKDKNKKLYKVIDYRGVWQNILWFCQVFGITFDCMMNSNWEVKEWWKMKDDTGIVSVTKEVLVDTFKRMLKDRSITIWQQLKWLIAQCNTFAVAKTQWGKVTYKWEKKTKDDFVFSLMNGLFFLWTIMGKWTKYEKKRLDDAKIQQQKNKKSNELTLEEMEKKSIEKSKQELKNKQNSQNFNRFFY